jgi:radical SAM superfamily enzyme YgiQ (UPF0313 family)
VRNISIYYCEPVYRPPSEAYSLLIQATEGCTYRCAFCVNNIGKKFKVRTVEDIKRDIDTALHIYGRDVRRIFFLDGNAMVMPFEQLLEITRYAGKVFPRLERVSVYAHARDILEKSEDDLRSLAEAGLTMAYIGIETGNDDLLKKIRKRQSADDIVQAFYKCFKTGITPSGTIILGLAGNDKDISYRHMMDTAALVNRASPTHVVAGGTLPVWYISCLALMIPAGTQVYKDMMEGRLIPMSADDILYEMKIFMEHISDEVQNCVFRSNHASNYLAIKGTLSADKEAILALINKNLQNKEDIRPEYFRAL